MNMPNLYQNCHYLLKYSVKCRTLLYPFLPLTGVRVKKHFHKESFRDEQPTQTVDEVIDKLCNKLGVSRSLKNFSYDRRELLKLLPSSQNDLPVRHMDDSWDSALIPLSQDPKLREKYVTFKGGVRIGRILEDLDVFAVWLCYKHILNPIQSQHPTLPSPYTLVTAMIDRMDFCHGAELCPDTDIRLSGHVSWVGKSSIETLLKVDQLQNGNWKQITEAVFVMVARDPLNQGSVPVNPLEPRTDEEKKIFEQGVRNKIARKAVLDESLFIMPPNDTEKSIVHDLFMNMADSRERSFAPKNKPANSRWIEDTKIKNLIICHPESQNIQGKIFGGFLMRQAFELTWITACLHSGERSFIRHIDDITFNRPVEIGSLLYLNSQVVYTDGHFMQLSTKASMMDPTTRNTALTNIFHFTFAADKEVPLVVPRAYHEAMMYLDGRRHFQLVQGDRRYYGQQEKPSDH